MPSPEQPHSQEHRERAPLPYAIAARFPSERASGRVYGRLQALVYARTDVDLSVYRLLLDRIPHVAVLGQRPAATVVRTITRLLGQGEPVDLPPEVLRILVERRAQAMQQGPWLARHHRPGKRL
jgi:hypothetical protein